MVPPALTAFIFVRINAGNANQSILNATIAVKRMFPMIQHAAKIFTRNGDPFLSAISPRRGENRNAISCAITFLRGRGTILSMSVP